LFVHFRSPQILFPTVQETAFKEKLNPPGKPAALLKSKFRVGAFACHPFGWVAFFKRFCYFFIQVIFF
jgi:hypothetical protein